MQEVNTQLLQSIKNDEEYNTYTIANETSKIILNDNIMEVTYNEKSIKIATNFNNLQECVPTFGQFASYSPRAINLRLFFTDKEKSFLYLIIPKTLFQNPTEEAKVPVEIDIDIEKIEPYQRPQTHTVIPPQNPKEINSCEKKISFILSHIKKYKYRYYIVHIIVISWYLMYKMVLQ